MASKHLNELLIESNEIESFNSAWEELVVSTEVLNKIANKLILDKDVSTEKCKKIEMARLINIQFGIHLKRRISEKQSLSEIGGWAYLTHCFHIKEIESPMRPPSLFLIVLTIRIYCNHINNDILFYNIHYIAP